MSVGADLIVRIAWLVAAALLVAGLRGMSSPRRALAGSRLAAAGMLLAVGATFALPQVGRQVAPVLAAIALGGAAGAFAVRDTTAVLIPRMIALLNAFGGGAAACVGIASLLVDTRIGVPDAIAMAAPTSRLHEATAVAAMLPGAVACGGSLLCFVRLGRDDDVLGGFAHRQTAYLSIGASVLLLALVLGASATAHPIVLVLFVALALAFGALMCLPIERTDLPVLVSMFNAATGLSVALDGIAFGVPVMIVAGMLVCAAGTLLTRLMAHGRNRRLGDIMYPGLGAEGAETGAREPRERVNRIDATEAAISLAWAGRVLVVPGYGLAVAQAQHKLRELMQLLDERGVTVDIALHPVAGRMPGHMNVVLAEAGVPYERLMDLEDANEAMDSVDVALVIGADDIVNPLAREERENALRGLVIVDVDRAARAIVLKRGEQTGHSGLDNPLLYAPDTRVMLGDALASLQELILEVKALD